MSNVDLILAYTENVAAWLTDQQLPHPPVTPGNRFPTSADLRWALAQLGWQLVVAPPDDPYAFVYAPDDPVHYLLRIEGVAWATVPAPENDLVAVKGSLEYTAVLLTMVCRQCGQLVLWPDSGEPPLVFDATADAGHMLTVWNAARQQADSWRSVFEQLYGQAAP